MTALVVLTGPPGAGKSTVGRLLARTWERSVHLHTDDFYAWVARGYVPPWLPEAHEQNVVVMDAIAGAAGCYAQGGYDVVVDGIVGPWFLDPWRALERTVSYAVLRPSLDAAERRAADRVEHRLKDLSVVATMYESFADLGEFERHVIDTTALSAEATVAEVRRRLTTGELTL